MWQGKIMNVATTLVTGASSGIGMHLARQFAEHGHPLVLVAPVQAELERVAAELHTAHNVEIQVIAKDLREPQAPQEIYDTLQANGTTIEILVNDAGHGRYGQFWEIPLDDEISMLRLNVEAVLRMLKLFVPPMVQRRHGRVLNVASVAGFEPGPRLAVYHATKAFVLSLNESLATELEDTSVTMTALCPGPTDTDFFPKAQMLDTRAFQQSNLMAPQEVAEAGYKGLMAGDRIVVPGGINKAMVFSRRMLTKSAQARFNQKLYERTKPSARRRSRGDKEAKAA